MQDVLSDLEKWIAEDETIAVATVVNTWGSSPRPVGSKLALTQSGRIAGSVSAGCVEGAVIEEGQAAIGDGKPRLLHYGVADEDSWEVGLACGGNIDVLVEPFTNFDPVFAEITANLKNRIPFALITPLDGLETWQGKKLLVAGNGRFSGDLLLNNHHDQVVTAALALLAAGSSGTVELEENLTFFVDVFLPNPRLIIVGAVHIAINLVTMANAAGFDTFVVDPRSGFATEERFAHATELVREWPQRALPKIGLDQFSYVVILTHDPKLDDPAIKTALPSAAHYIGALGSKRTNARRQERLLTDGIDAGQLVRLHAPIGLDLGGRTPGEIAVSILAELVQARNQKQYTERPLN